MTSLMSVKEIKNTADPKIEALLGTDTNEEHLKECPFQDFIRKIYSNQIFNQKHHNLST